jgi:HAD superfamily phosphatase (TIGR01668 family)
MLRFLAPDYRVHGVQELTLPRLAGLGLDSLLLDADCTLKRYASEDCTPEAAAWLADLRSAGVGLCLISNGRAERIGRFAARVGLPFVAGALKPLPWGCRRAVRMMGFRPERTAMVGDQLFADVLAGRWAGLTTILVDPIHPEDEHWFTRIKRGPERWLLRTPYSSRSA